MKYTISHYADAVLAALEKKSEEERRAVARRFLAVAQKHKKLRELSRILKEAEKRSYARSGTRRIFFEPASAVAESVKKEMRLILGRITIQERVRPDLLAGARIFVDDELLIDASAKRRLEKLFPVHE